MKRTSQGRHHRFEILDSDEPGPNGERLEFDDTHEAATFLWRLLHDLSFVAPLRDVLLAAVVDAGLSMLGDDEVIARLARLLVIGRVRVYRRAPRVFAAPGTPDDAEKKKEKPAPLKEQKYWIHFQLVDDETGEPVPGVTAKLKLPTGEIKTMTSDGEGRIRVRGLPSGTWDLQQMECSDVLEVTRTG